MRDARTVINPKNGQTHFCNVAAWTRLAAKKAYVAIKPVTRPGVDTHAWLIFYDEDWQVATKARIVGPGTSTDSEGEGENGSGGAVSVPASVQKRNAKARSSQFVQLLELDFPRTVLPREQVEATHTLVTAIEEGWRWRAAQQRPRPDHERTVKDAWAAAAAKSQKKQNCMTYSNSLAPVVSVNNARTP